MNKGEVIHTKITTQSAHNRKTYKTNKKNINKHKYSNYKITIEANNIQPTYCTEPTYSYINTNQS
jgi:hypothetical protein